MQFKKMSQKPDIIWPTNPTSEALRLVDTEKNRPKVGGVATYPLSSLSWTKKNTNGV